MAEQERISWMAVKYSDIKVGLICRADFSGLGFQTKELYNMLKPAKVLLIDSTPFNGRQQNPDWYDPSITTVSNGFVSNKVLLQFIKGIDVLISCEVPYNDNLYRFCRIKGVKTILQPNAELNPHMLNSRLDLPDAFFMPSPWLEDETRAVGIPTYIVKPPIIEPRTYLEIPKARGKLKVLHFGGRRAAHDRNGTEIVRDLPEIPGIEIDIHDQGANEVQDQRELYEQGHHVVLIPRRYGGLCLPMLESLSYGLPVVMPNIEPNRQELPKEWLTNATRDKMIRTKHRIDTYSPDRQSIIWTLERFRDMPQEQYERERGTAKRLYKEYLDQQKLWFKYIESVV
jgi:glycosyltransferase involved in cell wall biosynthesis